MQETVIAFILTFVFAFIITYFNSYTSDKFHNYFFLLKSNGTFVMFCFIYGLLGIGLLFILKDNVIQITNDNTRLGNYLYPIAVGISIKGVSELNLFNIKTNGFALPVGIRTITQPMDKFFEEKFDGICFRKSKKFLDQYSKKYLIQDSSATNKEDMIVFKQTTVKDLKNHHPDEKKTTAFSLSNQFTTAATSDEVLVLVLREFGPDVFKSIFSL